MEINIRDNWDRLSAATWQWLTDNPGCLILPRTLVATISKETDGNTDSDQHGETTHSQKDRDFIQATPRPIRARQPDRSIVSSMSGAGNPAIARAPGVTRGTASRW
ncbi:MAG: hypothetical protein QOH19_2883 [Actinomycetota bacterium]|nr:hypothetical protein [Actinomycetota bacterium]